MLIDTKDPRKLDPEDFEGPPSTTVESTGDEQGMQPMRELDEIHKIFDALGVPEGFAADRIVKWFGHKVVANRANGHQDSCQCQLCCEDRIVRRVFRKLRDPKVGGACAG